MSQLPFSINFYNSNISMSSFYQLDLRSSEIISCKSHEVDFAHTNLEKTNFKDTDLLNSTFNNTNLKNTDLSEAINYMINPKYNTLKATKVSLAQATSFLKFLDLKIVD
ncbi:MAG: pentapeptide repeat-containing protein [Arcobacteraceae bacterium]|nr:pentapeptide repeat-containing protein [Arcobacteraceae bacterium]